MTTASQVFDFLAEHPSCSVERRELHSGVFRILRRSIRTIITRLSEVDEPASLEIADKLRTHLSEWLTVPVPFDGSLLESISVLGDPEAVGRRWGQEVRNSYDLACNAAIEIQKTDNPARSELRQVIQQLQTQQKTWRIYCHHRARVHFESLFVENCFPSDVFLHSVRDYREVLPFEVLIKMGPLRSKGWGAAPDVLISGPRFVTLAQIVWAGCADEADFGYDPVSSRAAAEVSRGAQAGSTESNVRNSVTIIPVGEPTTDADVSEEFDELRFFQELTRNSEVRRASLVQISEGEGVLYPPHSQVAAFDPFENVDQIVYRMPGETLCEGMFLIWPLLGTADLGALRAGEGHYSRIWKQCLRDKLKYTPNTLLQELREGGIQLRNLRSCVQHWCRAATTVIHAPQQRRHFETLIKVLGITHESANASPSALRHDWWEYAWAEIARARGEAIQTGMQEHEIVDEELFLLLRELVVQIGAQAQTQSVFEISIPPNKPLQGSVRFYRVRSIEEGFLVPDTFLKVICDLDSVEQWRV